MVQQGISKFQQSLLDGDTFTLTFELVPSRGGWTREHTRILCLAKRIVEDGRIEAVSITENAGGHPALSPEVLGREIMDMGLDVISHFSCKDKNRNQIESLLFSWARQGLNNLLTITGDYPKKGYYGYPKPVFDIDSTQLLDLVKRMNSGLIGMVRSGKKIKTIVPTSFFSGVAVSPFKLLESELIMQYLKLKRKTIQGAHFAITQLGYDPRKFHEILLYIQENKLNIPLLGNVFIPNKKVLELMYRGEVPGGIIPESLYEQFASEWQSGDKGREARLVRGGKLLAVMKGMGYAGAHIGGPGLSMSDIDFLLQKSDHFTSRWRDFVEELSCWPDDCFFYYDKDPKSGLNQPVRRPVKNNDKSVRSYFFSKKVHDVVFDPDGLFYEPVKKLCAATDNSPFEKVFEHGEYIVKKLMYHCRNCGDCTLSELAFLCPQWGCAKYMLNGPCGGSRNGWCEVYPGKKRCLYVRLYERLSSQELEENWPDYFIPPRNWSLNETSSWINFFMGRDHCGGEWKKVFPNYKKKD